MAFDLASARPVDAAPPRAGGFDLKTARPAALPRDLDPSASMSTTDRVLAGAGSGLASVGRAVGLGGVLEHFGLPGTREEAAALDAPLEATAAGKVGKFVGQAAPGLLATVIPGTQGLAGSIAAGALTGGVTTEGDLAERASAAVGGAIGGGARLVGERTDDQDPDAIRPGRPVVPPRCRGPDDAGR